MNARRCETCEFFCRELEPVNVPVPGRTHAEPVRDVPMRPCRRYPPQTDDFNRAGFWPLVSEAALCGEWQAEWGPREPEPQGHAGDDVDPYADLK